MDHALILAGTLEQVQHDLSIIDEIAAGWAVQGYTIVETDNGKAVVGKNAATGEDNPLALTTSWATPEFSSSLNAWFIPSPSADARFLNWKYFIPEGDSIECQEIILQA